MVLRNTLNQREVQVNRITTRAVCIVRQAIHARYANIAGTHPEPVSREATQEGLLDDHPDLEPEDILTCVAYAHVLVAKRPPAIASMIE